MSHHPTPPLDTQTIIHEIQKVTQEPEKTKVRRVEQGKEFFQQYSFQKAILELDELFEV